MEYEVIINEKEKSTLTTSKDLNLCSIDQLKNTAFQMTLKPIKKVLLHNNVFEIWTE